jgi:amidophosphoribosyltransferase
MARAAGANKVYFASAAPEVRFPNVYGIDMPSANELIAHGRELDDICNLIGADKLIFQSIDDLIDAVRGGNPDIKNFDTSVFDGSYVTNDINQDYLEKLDALRNNTTKEATDKNADSIIDMYNEGAE